MISSMLMPWRRRYSPACRRPSAPFHCTQKRKMVGWATRPVWVRRSAMEPVVSPWRTTKAVDSPSATGAAGAAGATVGAGWTGALGGRAGASSRGAGTGVATSGCD